jgi:hypothetical protein
LSASPSAPRTSSATISAASQDVGAGRYWLEHGQHVRSAGDVIRLGKAPQEGLGKSVLLSAIAAADLTTYAARGPAGLSNRSVNIELEHLRGHRPCPCLVAVKHAGARLAIDPPRGGGASVNTSSVRMKSVVDLTRFAPIFTQWFGSRS